MPITFPNNSTTNQTHSTQGRVWVWTGTNLAVQAQAVTQGATGATGITGNLGPGEPLALLVVCL